MEIQKVDKKKRAETVEIGEIAKTKVTTGTKLTQNEKKIQIRQD